MDGTSPFIVAPRPQPGPARCAGLRHALLHDWQQGFPVEASPFQVLARRLGGSVREVMAHCHALGEEGALAGISIRWGESLQRVHWRCVLTTRPRRPAEFAACLRALPGVTGWEEIVPLDAERDDAVPALWFDLHARDLASAQARMPSTRDSDTSTCGVCCRRFMFGTRSVPPAISIAPGPSPASTCAASAIVRGAT